jgi:hypothetical protein
MIGKIYSIENLDRSIIYIGSTTRGLSNRWIGHISGYKSWMKGKSSTCSIYPYFKELGHGEFNIRLLESHEIDTKEQLRIHEQAAIERYPNAVNANKAHRTREGYLEQVRNSVNRFKKNHPEQFRERQKKTYAKHREEIIERGRHRVICDCGITYNQSGKTQHLRSRKHHEGMSHHSDVSITSLKL